MRRFVSFEELKETVRDFVNGLTEEAFDKLRLAARSGWKDWLTSTRDVPSEESLEELAHAIEDARGSSALPIGATPADKYKVTLAVFYAVNERFHRDYPLELGELR